MGWNPNTPGGSGIANWGGKATAQFTHAGDPNGHVTALAKGDLCVDTTTPALYQAAGAGTVWTLISGGSGPSWIGPRTFSFDTPEGTLWPELAAALVPGALILGYSGTSDIADGNLNISFDGTDAATKGYISLASPGFIVRELASGDGSIVEGNQTSNNLPFIVVGDASALAVTNDGSPPSAGSATISILVMASPA